MLGRYIGLSPSAVTLTSGLFKQRFELNRAYLLSLKPENLLQNHHFEAGMGRLSQLRNTILGNPGAGDDLHWGWESPTCQLRGHFLGHWLSAAARVFAATGDAEMKARVDRVVAELGRCQDKNGGEWVFSIPEKYFHWLAKGQSTWAPQYVAHKTLMGLIDAHRYAGSEQALAIAGKAAQWFHRWTAPFSRKAMDDILDVETGGMLEVWADLYGVTKSPLYEELMERYTRSRLFDPLMNGMDALTNMHANTTIPEVLGAARAYEVTGNERWRQIAEAYWKCAVDARGFFCTGGQTAGETWTPPFQFSSRRSDKNQEFCTVYNMIRLADFLFRWSGDVKYADYIERNIYNGMLAQQNPGTGMVCYYLPLRGGSRKTWGTPTCDFWCCHGTLAQAYAFLNGYVYYVSGKELLLSQFTTSRLAATVNGSRVEIEMRFNPRSQDGSRKSPNRPYCWTIELDVQCERPVDFDLKIRIPWWVNGKPFVAINGREHEAQEDTPGFCTLCRSWQKDTVHVMLPRKLTTSPIPDEADTVAFLDGPVVLAGLCDREQALRGAKNVPDRILAPDNEDEKDSSRWLPGYRTVGQPAGIRFRPLYEIVDEPYTLYYPVSPGTHREERHAEP